MHTKLKTPGLSERQMRIFTFLQTYPVGVLSTISPEDQPHGSTIYFHTNELFTISFLTKVDTRKYDNLQFHSHVALTVFDTATQTTVQIVGEAEEITDAYEINRIAGSILHSSLKTSKNLPPVSKLDAGPYAAFRIRPHQIHMTVYSPVSEQDYDDIFDTVETFELNPGKV